MKKSKGTKMKKSKEIRAIFIDVVNKKVTDIDMPKGLQNIYKQLGYGRIELIPLGMGVFMYVDETARLKPKSQLQGWFIFAQKMPVLNNAIVFLMDDEGDKKDMIINADVFQHMLEFKTLKDIPNFNNK